MAASIAKLQSKYKPTSRYANFGAVIRRMHVCGFRGIQDLTIDFDFPITAISGLNGAGKSTIGQLAMCGYRMPTGAVDYKRFYIAQFFPVSVADPLPFDQDARVVYTLDSNVPTAPQEVTVSRAASEWSGYKRQPERYCYYIGFTLYIPKVERRDMSVYGVEPSFLWTNGLCRPRSVRPLLGFLIRPTMEFTSRASRMEREHLSWLC